MNYTQTEQIDRITRRWQQAHCHRQLLDWHGLTGHLLNLAGTASRFARTPEEKQHASDLYTLAGLSYERSTEFFPADLSRLPHLMCEAA